MSVFSKKLSIRWADLDPNFHLRHSVYYDFGAQQRMEVLYSLGLTPELMQNQHFGPVIFREECLFRREIKWGDEVTISALLAQMKADASRWSIRHELVSDVGKGLAVLTVEGAWIDTQKRKLLSPVPPIVSEVFNAIPRSDQFVLL